MNKNKLTICIPAYNAEEWISETLQSILPINEAVMVIISDNHSTDRTLEKIEYFTKHNLNVKLKVIRPTHHLTMAENWNFAIGSANSPYVALVSADDLISSEMCVRAISELDYDPLIDIVTFEHDRIIHSGSDKTIVERRVAHTLTEGMATPLGLILNKNPFSINFSFIRINSDRIRGASLNKKLFHRNAMTTDYDFWIRSVLNGCSIKYIKSPKGYYRVHGGNLSNNRVKMLIQTFLVVIRHREALQKTCNLTYKFLMFRLYIRCILLMRTSYKKCQRLRSALLKSIFSGLIK